MDINPHESRDTPSIEITVLERKIINPQSAVSKYKAGKTIITVESLFSSERIYQDLLFRIVQNKLEK